MQRQNLRFSAAKAQRITELKYFLSLCQKVVFVSQWGKGISATKFKWFRRRLKRKNLESKVVLISLLRKSFGLKKNNWVIPSAHMKISSPDILDFLKMQKGAMIIYPTSITLEEDIFFFLRKLLLFFDPQFSKSDKHFFPAILIVENQCFFASELSIFSFLDDFSRLKFFVALATLFFLFFEIFYLVHLLKKDLS